jgi:2'-5' RNA ligase
MDSLEADRPPSPERLRLFFGLPLPAEVQEPVARWQARAFGDARVRVVAPRHLHVTLAFLGSRPAEEVESLAVAVRETAEGRGTPTLVPTRYRETERVAMLVFSDEGDIATALQARLSDRLEAMGVYRPERRRWLPHVTVARFQRRPRLQPALPELGPVTLSEAALYRSMLTGRGAVYDVLASVPLAQIGA